MVCADPVARDQLTTDLRGLLSETLGSATIISSLLPIDEGLLQITTARA